MSVTAYEFKRDFLDKQAEGSAYQLVTQNMSYYFFSHLHNLEISHIEFPVTAQHLVSFIEWYAFQYDGDCIGRAFEQFTRNLARTNQDIHPFTWNILYSMSIYKSRSEAIQAAIFAIENGKPACTFYSQVRKIIADNNSIAMEDLYLDVLEINQSEIANYFSAIYGKHAAMKMYLLKELSKVKLTASAMIHRMMIDHINGEKYRAKKQSDVESLSLNNLPFAKMAGAKIVGKEKRDITKWKDGSLDIRKVLALQNDSKPHKPDTLTKQIYLDAAKDRVEQRHYINQQAAITENSLANGMAVLRKHTGHYNHLVSCYKELEEAMYTMFFKVQNAQGSKPGAKSLEREPWFKKTAKFSKIGAKIHKLDIFEVMGSLTDTVEIDACVSTTVKFPKKREFGESMQSYAEQQDALSS